MSDGARCHYCGGNPCTCEPEGWIGVDLDGTLAHYDHWRGVQHVGVPVPLMLARVKAWLAAGETVKIFTARISVPGEQLQVRRAIENWCMKHLGVLLEITNVKDLCMTELWDDRAVQVVANTGERVGNYDNPPFVVGQTNAPVPACDHEGFLNGLGDYCRKCGWALDHQ